MLSLARFATLPSVVYAIKPSLENEINRMEPVLSSLLELSVNGTEKGASYNFTADFCDRWGHRISGSKNLEDSIDALLASLESASGLDNIHHEPAMVPHWV
jgi:carboxypeptidase Q